MGKCKNINSFLYLVYYDPASSEHVQSAECKLLPLATGTCAVVFRSVTVEVHLKDVCVYYPRRLTWSFALALS